MSGLITKTFKSVRIKDSDQGTIEYRETVTVTDTDSTVHDVNDIYTVIGPYKPSSFGGYTLNTATDLAEHPAIVADLAEGLWTADRAAAHLAALPPNIV